MLLARRLRHALTGARSFSVELFSADHVLSPDTDSATTTTTTTERGGSGRGRDRLGRRLLSLIYPKRSAIIALRKWTEKGNTAQKYQLNHIVRELRKLKRYKHALEICEWMTIQEDIKLLPGDYAVHLDLVAKVRGLASAEKFFEDLPEQMKGPSTCTALLHTYVQNKLSTKAEALMEEMSSNGFLRCALPYNNMLHLYISSGQTDKVPKMIQELKKNTSPDVMTYNLWLNTFANSDDVLGAAEEVLLDMRQRKINADWVTHSVLANIYIKSALTKKARESLKEMEKNISRKERSAHCSLITLHTNLANKDDVYRIWEEMKLKYRKMSDAEYTCMLASLVKLGEIEEAESIYDEWESVSRTGDSRVANLLLAFYIRSDMMEKAENFHDRMVQKEIKPSYTTWELMAWGYLGRKKMDKVLDCLKNALSRLKKWEPDYPIVKSVFDNLEMSGDIEIAEKFLIMLRDAGYVTTQIYNSLLKTYAKAGKMPLIIVERMTKDNVQLDEETRRLMKLTSKLCVGEVSTLIS